MLVSGPLYPPTVRVINSWRRHGWVAFGAWVHLSGGLVRYDGWHDDGARCRCLFFFFCFSQREKQAASLSDRHGCRVHRATSSNIGSPGSSTSIFSHTRRRLQSIIHLSHLLFRVCFLRFTREETVLGLRLLFAKCCIQPCWQGRNRCSFFCANTFRYLGFTECENRPGSKKHVIQLWPPKRWTVREPLSRHLLCNSSYTFL